MKTIEPLCYLAQGIPTNGALWSLHYNQPKPHNFLEPDNTDVGHTFSLPLIPLAGVDAHKMVQQVKNIFGENVPDKIKASIEYELTFIGQVNYSEYFLTVYDIVRYAREQKILCQGRGSAANSTVCYCLGITSVDPSKFDLLFERFISSARN